MIVASCPDGRRAGVTLDGDHGIVGPHLDDEPGMDRGGGAPRPGAEEHGISGCGQDVAGEDPAVGGRPGVDVAGEGDGGDRDPGVGPHPGDEERAPLLRTGP